MRPAGRNAQGSGHFPAQVMMGWAHSALFLMFARGSGRSFAADAVQFCGQASG
jgi:hypothetical protein